MYALLHHCRTIDFNVLGREELRCSISQMEKLRPERVNVLSRQLTAEIARSYFNSHESGLFTTNIQQKLSPSVGTKIFIMFIILIIRRYIQ